MSKKFTKFLRALYPEAYELAVQRVLAGQTIFFDRLNRKLFSDDLILVTLIIAHFYVAKHKLKLRLTQEEKRIWNQRFDSEIPISQQRG